MKYAPASVPALLLAATLFAAPAGAVPTLPGAAAPAYGVIQVLCKYGSPHCVNPNPRPGAPSVGGAQIPDSGWEDPDCKYYGSCGTGTPGNWGDPAGAARAGSSGPAAGRTGTRMLNR